MSTKNNDQGRAFEYACLTGLEKEISKIRPCHITQNSSLEAARRSWETISDSDKNIYTLSSLAAIRKILLMEPKIIEKSNDTLELLIQPDSKGTEGDVRDIIIFRQAITWEIGLSVKHNNFAVK